MAITQFIKTISFTAIASIFFFASSCSDGEMGAPQLLTVSEPVAGIKSVIRNKDGKLIFTPSSSVADTYLTSVANINEAKKLC